MCFNSVTFTSTEKQEHQPKERCPFKGKYANEELITTLNLKGSLTTLLHTWNTEQCYRRKTRTQNHFPYAQKSTLVMYRQ